MKPRDAELKADAALSCSATGSPISGSWVPKASLKFKVKTASPQGEGSKNKTGPPSTVPHIYVSSNTSYVLKPVLGAADTALNKTSTVPAMIQTNLAYFMVSYIDRLFYRAEISPLSYSHRVGVIQAGYPTSLSLNAGHWEGHLCTIFSEVIPRL